MQNKLKDLILSTKEIFSLPSAVIEKDYYVTQIILNIGDLEDNNFRLVFCGGTCLAKAHKIVQRMSEDIDFKITAKELSQSLSKTRFLKELKNFRSLIMQRIEQSGLKLEYTTVRNEGKYTRVELSYPSIFPANSSLRPHFLLEFTLSEIRLPTSHKIVSTLIEDALSIPPLFEKIPIDCICVEETAAEKWVGLTRRIMAIQRKYHERK